MRKVFLLVVGLIPAVCAFAATAPGVYGLTADWRFAKARETIPLARALASLETAGTKVESAAFDDSGWERVGLPHAVNAHDSFDSRAEDAGEGDYFRGVMVYRRRVRLDGVAGRKFFLEFETVRQTLYVWVNGRPVGYYEAGIAPSCYDISAAVKDGENLIVVATDNCAARGTKIISRETIPGREPGDQSGAVWQWNTADFNEVQGGLAAVRLHVKAAQAYLTLPFYNNLKTVGAYVTAKDFDFVRGSATVAVKAEMRNEGAVERFGIRATVCDAGDGKTLARFASDIRPVARAADAGVVFPTSLEADVYAADPRPTHLAGPETAVFAASASVDALTFWSPDTPHLYDVRIELVDANGAILDTTVVRTGFRKVAYDAATGGLSINGKNVWLRGYAQRATHEWAAIGVAPDWLQDFDARLIRASNANFVRWMHVAPKPAPVRAFDKHGVVCVAPAGDKESDATDRAWAQRMEAMRDTMIYYRNSPSVLFWEAGNNQITPAHMKAMRELKETIDPDGGRFCGCRTLRTPEQVAEAEFVGTMLHRHETPAFEAMKKIGRMMPIVETEYARQESPRRCWDDFTPPHYDYVCKWLGGGRKRSGYDVHDQTQEDFALSTAKEYAAYYAAWSNGTGPRTYAACAALCWTDSNQHGRQSGSENARMSGRVDPVRIPKQNFHVFRAMQSDAPAIRLVGHWNYPKFGPDAYRYRVKKSNGTYWAETGETAQRDPRRKTVYAIGSPHVASAELFVNGKSKGVATKPDDLFVWAFKNVDVTEPGVAEVVARDAAGKEIARDELASAGSAAQLVLKVVTGPDGFQADGGDVAFVDLRLADAQGRTLPLASDKVTFKLSGDAVFMGGYNSGVWGDASPIGKDWVNLECGVNRVFIKAGRTAGRIRLDAVCANGLSASVEFDAKAVPSVGGLMRAFPPSDVPNRVVYATLPSAPVVQNALNGAPREAPWTVRVNGAPVRFATVQPAKPDANTGVCGEYAPVLEALKAAGAAFTYVLEPKRIPPTKKWLRKLSPTPFVPMVTVRAGGREIDACVGFTELFLDDGKEKDLTNCEIFCPKRKSPVVCGELASLVGYIPDVTVKTDEKKRLLDFTVDASKAVPAPPRVARWRGDKRAAVSYTFDDGLRDQYELAFPWLKRAGLRATFYLNGAAIESRRPTRQGAARMTWEMARELAANGQELGNHGLAHLNHGRFPRAAVETDIASNDVLIAARTGVRPVTFAYPNNAKAAWSAAVVDPGRVGSRLRQTGFGGGMTAARARELFANAKKTGGWLVFMLHGIATGYDAWQDPSQLDAHFKDAAADRDVWIDTFAAVSIYERLREETQVGFERTADGWRVKVTPPKLDPKLFRGTLDLVLSDGSIHAFNPFQGDFLLNVVK